MNNTLKHLKSILKKADLNNSYITDSTIIIIGSECEVQFYPENIKEIKWHKRTNTGGNCWFIELQTFPNEFRSGDIQHLGTIVIFKSGFIRTLIKI